jgi:hypothetical protein
MFASSGRWCEQLACRCSPYRFATLTFQKFQLFQLFQEFKSFKTFNSFKPFQNRAGLNDWNL